MKGREGGEEECRGGGREEEGGGGRGEGGVGRTALTGYRENGPRLLQGVLNGNAWFEKSVIARAFG